jgi:yeeA
MASIKFLDPACGSGNFLIITYKELRRLEINILIKQREIRESLNEKAVYQGELIADASKISLPQFSGIELDDFAHEVARLSLYIAEHQMNVEMEEALADVHPRLLPLREAGNIVCGNALRIDWTTVLNAKADDEVYIFGNPPYIGSKKMTLEQKKELENVICSEISSKKLDYISGWFYKATHLIYGKNAQYAFVTTNSINQGEQVSILWSVLLQYGQISFAYQSFKWNNSAAHNAGVTVTIIGFSNKNDKKRIIYSDKGESYGKNINPYLAFADDIIVSNHNDSEKLNNFPKIVFGNMPRSKYLILTNDDKNQLVQRYPETEVYFKKYIGADEYINGNFRYTIWIDQDEYTKLDKIQEFHQLFENVRQERLNSKAAGTRETASTPWKFVQRGEWDDMFSKGKIEGKFQLLVPAVTSEDRDYIPMGFVGDDTIISNRCYIVYDTPIWLLGCLVSKMHIKWFQAIGGKLETRYSYSAGLVYNTFPIPELSDSRKNMLEEAVFEMLDVREEEGGTLAELYGGANKPMNERLRQAHEKIDGIVERAYQQKPFESDEERLSVLLNLYKEMTEKEAK